MTVSESDKASLKAADVLHAYCCATLGEGKRQGPLTFYPCPWGAHTRLKLEVRERDGVGVALCRACNQGGDVFSVASGVLGLDARKDFEAVAQAVAQAVGYTLTSDGEKAHARRKAGFPRPSGTRARKAIMPPAEKATERVLEYLPPDEEARALEAVERLKNTPHMLEHWARALGLPSWLLRAHTNATECASLGLIGLDERDRLLYLYTHSPDDSERVRVLGVKTRNPKGFSPRFLMRGRKQALWGEDAMSGHDIIIMAEGETDALAVRASLDSWQEQERTLFPDDYPEPEQIPAVVARPDAGTFPQAWIEASRQKRVILLADRDEQKAGERGALAIVQKLKEASIKHVHIWLPPMGCKDARDAFNAEEPWSLFESIISDNIEQ